MSVHNCTLRWDADTFHFASIDGEDWLELSRPLEPGEEETFERLLNGDGNFMPLRFRRRWLEHQRHAPGREVTFHASV